MIHVGIDFACQDTNVNTGNHGMRNPDANLFEFVKVCCGLEGPQARNVLGRLKRLRWLPIFDTAILISGDDSVEAVAVLNQGIQYDLEQPQRHAQS